MTIIPRDYEDEEVHLPTASEGSPWERLEDLKRLLGEAQRTWMSLPHHSSAQYT